MNGGSRTNNSVKKHPDGATSHYGDSCLAAAAWQALVIAPDRPTPFIGIRLNTVELWEHRKLAEGSGTHSPVEHALIGLTEPAADLPAQIHL